jgi:hypothetical protein
MSTNARLSERVKNYPKLATLLPNLAKYNFVAATQMTLEVTDVEGFNPTLSFIKPFNGSTTFNRTLGIGFQLNGTQDRSLTINYSIDVAQLAYDADWEKEICEDSPDDEVKAAKLKRSTETIAGDLGIADIISDGLITLDDTQSQNLYSNSGPVPPIVQLTTLLSGPVTQAQSGGTDPFAVGNVVIRPNLYVNGLLTLSPPQANAVTASTVTLTGTANETSFDAAPKYALSLTGTMAPPQENAIYFTLTGNFNPLDASVPPWSFNPTVNFTGSVAKDDAGKVTVQIQGTMAGTGTAPPLYGVKLASQPQQAPAGGGFSVKAVAAGTKGGGTTASAASGASTSQGTSFGSIVDFILTFGLNGGPNWSVAKFKGPSGGGGGGSSGSSGSSGGGGGGGGGQLLSASRMNTDTLSITFVASCRKVISDPFQSLQLPTTYWQSIGPCDTSGTAQQQSAIVGYGQNNVQTFERMLRP